VVGRCWVLGGRRERYGGGGGGAWQGQGEWCDGVVEGVREMEGVEGGRCVLRGGVKEHLRFLKLLNVFSECFLAFFADECLVNRAC
jgi:hypothetical protein